MLKRERVYCHYFLHMDNHPVGLPLLYETPLGMFCLYGKVMRSTTAPTTVVVCCTLRSTFDYLLIAGALSVTKIEGDTALLQNSAYFILVILHVLPDSAPAYTFIQRTSNIATHFSPL